MGATRHCDLALMGATVEEKIIEWNEGKSLKIEVSHFKKLPGIKTMDADFSVRLENGKTILRADLNYSMKNIIFDLMNSLIMKRMNIKLWDSNVAGHKKYIESGTQVTQKTDLELDKVIALN